MFKSNETSSSALFQAWKKVYCQVLNELEKLYQTEEINALYKQLKVINTQLFDFCENGKIANQPLLKNNLSKLIAFFSKNEHIKELLETLFVELPEALGPVNSLTRNEDVGKSLLNSRLPSEIFLEEIKPHLSPKATIYLSQTCRFFLKHLKQSIIEIKKPRLAAGGAHTLIYINCSLYSFGRNGYGQLGLGHTDPQLVPTRVKLLDKSIKSIACGEGHSIIVYDDGSVYSFGWNKYGQLGLGHTSNQAEPQQVKLPGKSTFAACGEGHSIIVCDDGSVYSFGWNKYGQLGLGHTRNQAEPEQVKLPGKATFAACGFGHSIIVCDDGSVYSFGGNECGQLGLGDTRNQAEPQQVKLPGKATFAACGFGHSIIVCDDGSVYSLGWNKYGQLGLGHTRNQAEPKQVKGLRGKAIFVVCGKNHSMVLCENMLYAFGMNQFGQCSGKGSVGYNFYETPELIESKVQFIACGAYHTILYKGGRVYAFGLNKEAQLGLGYTMSWGYDYEATPELLKLTSLDEDETTNSNGSLLQRVTSCFGK
jgi:alpha-tubulin suppressor-like RCC1 family protein